MSMISIGPVMGPKYTPSAADVAYYIERRKLKQEMKKANGANTVVGRTPTTIEAPTPPAVAQPLGSVPVPANPPKKKRGAKKKKAAAPPATTAPSTGRSVPIVPGPPDRTPAPGPRNDPPPPRTTSSLVPPARGDHPQRIDSLVQDFFGRFQPWFVHDTQKTPRAEFRRLIKQFRLSRSDVVDFEEVVETRNFRNLMLQVQSLNGSTSQSAVSQENKATSMRAATKAEATAVLPGPPEEGPFRMEGPIQEFFDRFLPWFIFDARKPLGTEFQRMIDHFKTYDEEERERLGFNEGQERRNFWGLIQAVGYPAGLSSMLSTPSTVPNTTSSSRVPGSQTAPTAPPSAAPQAPRIAALAPRPAYIANFFAQYAPRFIYRPEGSSSSEWYRLCAHKGWERDNDEREAAYKTFQRALVRQFDAGYGTDENDIDNWRYICQMLGLDVPGTLEETRDLVKSTHVNLVDLTDALDGRDVEIFGTEVELSAYTLETGNFFSRRAAFEYGGGVLVHLLRHILHPRGEHVFPGVSPARPRRNGGQKSQFSSRRWF